MSYILEYKTYSSFLLLKIWIQMSIRLQIFRNEYVAPFIIHIFVPWNKIGWNEDISWHSCMNTRLVQRHWMNVLCVCNWNSFKFHDSWNLTMRIFSRLNRQFRLVDLKYLYQTFWNYTKKIYKYLQYIISPIPLDKTKDSKT